MSENDNVPTAIFATSEVGVALVPDRAPPAPVPANRASGIVKLPKPCLAERVASPGGLFGVAVFDVKTGAEIPTKMDPEKYPPKHERIKAGAALLNALRAGSAVAKPDFRDLLKGARVFVEAPIAGMPELKHGEDVTAKAAHWPTLGAMISRKILRTVPELAKERLFRLVVSPADAKLYNPVRISPADLGEAPAAVAPAAADQDPAVPSIPSAPPEIGPVNEALFDTLMALTSESSVKDIRDALEKAGAQLPGGRASKADLLAIRDEIAGQALAV